MLVSPSSMVARVCFFATHLDVRLEVFLPVREMSVILLRDLPFFQLSEVG
jgi:hypothetical protein